MDWLGCQKLPLYCLNFDFKIRFWLKYGLLSYRDFRETDPRARLLEGG